MHGPTVKPASKFCPTEDAEHLHKAMKLFGANEAEVINVLCNRSNEQRQEIAAQYKTHYGRELVEELEDELWGEFKDLMLALMDQPATFIAKQLHMGIYEKRSDICMEVLATCNNDEIHRALQVYEAMYGPFATELDQHNIHNRGLIELLAKCSRRLGEKADRMDVEQMADSLLWKEGSSIRLYKEPFYQLLATENQMTLRSVIANLEIASGKPIDELIRSSLPEDDNGHCLIVAVKALLHPHTFFAESLKSYFGLDVQCWGLPSTHRDIIRIVVGRAEKDLADIHQRYEELYDDSFEESCKEYASGSYQLALLRLIKPSSPDVSNLPA